MILSKINYFEHKGKPNYWEINDVVLSSQNLIVGLNATGKTRLTNVIINLGKILGSKLKTNGNWCLEFIKDETTKYKFELQINNKHIDCEKIWQNDISVLERDGNGGKIFSKSKNDWDKYSPPADELTLNVRRDLEHYPYLEDFIEWSKNIKGYSFSGVKSDQIMIPDGAVTQLESLGAVPYILQQIQNDKTIIDKIIEDLNFIGYPVESVTSIGIQQPAMQNLFMVSLKEKDLLCKTEQGLMSQGMYRAVCLIVLFEYLLAKGTSGTIIIDDLGEGLDFERSTKLTKLLLNKNISSKFQVIITSNDRFLINTVDMKNINFLTRKGHIVKATNYSNNKKLFDKYLLSGLNNFDLLQSGIKNSKN
jgi:predicted ATPase